MIRHLALAAFAQLLCTAACAGDLLAEVNEVLEARAVVQGTFEQTSTTTALRVPLKSRGTFFVDRELGVVWRVATPVEAQFAWPTLPAESAPRSAALDWVATLLGAAVRGDFGSIGQMFELDGGVSEGAWHLELTPRLAVLKRTLKVIELRGTTVIELVRVVQTNADSSAIVFSNVEYPTELPSDVRAALIAHP